MPKPYPDPGFNTTTGVFEYANTVTNGWMGILFMIASMIIIFVISKQKGYRISDSLLISNLLTFILGSLLWSAGIIQGKILMIFLLFTVGSAIYSVLDD